MYIVIPKTLNQKAKYGLEVKDFKVYSSKDLVMVLFVHMDSKTCKYLFSKMNHPNVYVMFLYAI